MISLSSIVYFDWQHLSSISDGLPPLDSFKLEMLETEPRIFASKADDLPPNYSPSPEKPSTTNQPCEWANWKCDTPT